MVAVAVRACRYLAAMAAVIAFLVSAAHAETTLTFGVYTSDKPTAMVHQMRPTLDVLQAAMSRTLGDHVHIVMRVADDYKIGLQLITSGKVDFARLGAASYVMAKKDSPDITLLAAEKFHGSHFFKGVICVRDQSKITTVAQLKGESFAFGSKRSTIGRYLAQIYLAREGIRASDLRAYAYLGRHDRVGTAVGAGEFDAGALEQTIFRKLQKSGVPIRAIAWFPNVTKAWVARAGLNHRIVAALRRGLLAIKDPAALAALRFNGFVKVDDADYRMVRRAIAENQLFFRPHR